MIVVAGVGAIVVEGAAGELRVSKCSGILHAGYSGTGHGDGVCSND